MFGPAGAGIGAVVGAIGGGVVGLISTLFGNSKQRKAEEATHNSAMVSALSGLNQIKSALDTRPPTMDWQQGKNQATEIQTAYFNAMNQLKDNKTRKNAIADGHGRIDNLVGQIQVSADAARAWQINKQNTSSQLVGEFASGNYMSAGFLAQYGEFKRRNGMLSGAFTFWFRET